MNIVFNDISGYQRNISCEPLGVEAQYNIGYTAYSIASGFDITGNHNIQVRNKIFLNGSSEVFALNDDEKIVKIGNITP